LLLLWGSADIGTFLRRLNLGRCLWLSFSTLSLMVLF
jgi:hypothetical protein